MVDEPQRRLQVAAAGGIAGPVAFAAAWSILGSRIPDYSAVEDAISMLAATGSPDRAAMTAGMVAFGVGVPAYAAALRATLPGPAWLCAAATGLAALGVAAFPLGAPWRDDVHGVFAALAYASLAATPLAAAAPLARQGRRRLALASVGVGTVSAALLLATVAGPASGLLQRAGLTIGHAWLVASAVGVIRGLRSSAFAITPRQAIT